MAKVRNISGSTITVQVGDGKYATVEPGGTVELDAKTAKTVAGLPDFTAVKSSTRSKRKD